MKKPAVIALAISLSLFLLPSQTFSARNGAYPPPPAPGQKISIEDTVYGVFRHHRGLRGIQENREVLTHELDRAYRGYGPRVDVYAAGGWGLLSDSTTRRQNLDDSLYTAVKLSATLVQPIWDGFLTRSRVRAARSTLESVKHRVFDNATSLALDGIIAHVNLLRCRTLVELSQNNVDIHKRILDMATDRANIGADTAADASQASSRYQRALSFLSEQQASLRIAEDTYTRLTGIPASSALCQITMPPVVYKDSLTVFKETEKSNPKLAAYMEDIRVQRAEREGAESTFYPTINVEAGPNYTNRGGNTDRWTYSFDIMLTLRWNIFNSGADVAEYQAASARIRQARQLYYDYMDDLKLDIDSTWSNYVAAQEQYRHYTKAMEFNKYTLGAYHEQFQIGRRTLLEVLDSENELYNSSTQAETARSNILIGAYRLLAITGTMLPRMNLQLDGLDKAPVIDPEDSREVFKMGWFD